MLRIAARTAFAVFVMVALVFAGAAEGRALKQRLGVVTPTPFRPLTGPRVTTVGPLGVASSTTRATPFNPFVGPVTTTTGVRATPFNPFIGPVGGTVVTIGH